MYAIRSYYAISAPVSTKSPVSTSRSRTSPDALDLTSTVVSGSTMPAEPTLTWLLSGGAGSERVLQYRNGVVGETFWRRSLVQRATAAIAPYATPAAYVRLGVTGQVRRTEYLQLASYNFV